MSDDPSNSQSRPPPVAGLLSLVIPVLNERESLARLYTEIASVSATLPQRRFEVLFIDDGSTDGSWEVIRQLAADDPRVRGIKFRGNFGKAAALEAGFRAAAGEIVFTLDADLQDDPHEIPRFLAALADDRDLVSGYKQVRHDPWHKVFPSRVFNRMVSAVTGVKLHDHNCGFKAYRAAVVRGVRLYGELHRYVPVLASAQGFSVGEIVVNHRPRQFGRSKFGWKRFVKGFLDLLQVRFVTAYGWRPMHFLGTAALISFGVTAVSVVALVLTLLILDGRLAAVVSSLSAVLAVVSAVFGGQCLLTGFTSELIAARRTDEPFRIAETTPPPGASG